MNENLLQAGKKAKRFNEYLQSEARKEVRKFAEGLITHKDETDFVSIIEDALILYDFETWDAKTKPLLKEERKERFVTLERKWVRERKRFTTITRNV